MYFWVPSPSPSVRTYLMDAPDWNCIGFRSYLIKIYEIWIEHRNVVRSCVAYFSNLLEKPLLIFCVVNFVTLYKESWGFYSLKSYGVRRTEWNIWREMRFSRREISLRRGKFYVFPMYLSKYTANKGISILPALVARWTCVRRSRRSARTPRSVEWKKESREAMIR